MIKKYIINKANVLVMCFILISLFCLIPVSDEELMVDNSNKIKSNIFLLDKDNYVSMVTYFFDESSIIDLISSKLNMLINGMGDNFIPLIPKNTKINKIDVIKDSVYIDFSNDFYRVSEFYQDEMLESIIYSICDIEGINYVYLSIDGKEFKKFPNSNNEYSYPLSKDFGINKEYNINDFKNISKTVVVFAKKIDDLEYYVPVTKVYNSSDDKIEIIIEELKSNVNSQYGLVGYLDNNFELVNYSINDDSITMVFNGVENKVYEQFISLSIRENYKNMDIIYKYE